MSRHVEGRRNQAICSVIKGSQKIDDIFENYFEKRKGSIDIHVMLTKFVKWHKT